MLDFRLLRAIIDGNGTLLPNLASLAKDELPDEGLGRGVLVFGEPGTGKSSFLTNHTLGYAGRHSNAAMLILDLRGGSTNSILKAILQMPEEQRENLESRLVYDDLGNPDWVVPLPEFSKEYGISPEEQVQRVAQNLAALVPQLSERAPILGGLGIRETAPETFRLLMAIKNEQEECWQITETKRLLTDVGLLKSVISRYGGSAPAAKWYFENEYLPLRADERKLRTFSLISILGAIESKPLRARLGCYRPGWSPKEAIEKGQIVLIDGSRLRNQEVARDYLFTQIFSLIMAEMNKRKIGEENLTPVSLVIDEVNSLLKIPNMAKQIADIVPQYRASKLQLYVVIQELAQLGKDLREHIWSLGNVVCFSVSDFKEAFETAQQLFPYEPMTVRVRPNTPNQRPIMEPDRGQYLKAANCIRDLKHRECFIRRYFSEKDKDPFIRHVDRTVESSHNALSESVEDFKERLLKNRGVRVRDALEEINRRHPEVSKSSHAPTIS